MMASAVSSLPGLYRIGLTACAVLMPVILAATEVRAESFALSVSPPRLELEAKPGETIRAVIELANSSPASVQLQFSTSEWELSGEGKLITSSELKSGSCRPWVAIERRQTTLLAASQLRYRIEIAPPLGTAPTECRFALLVSGGGAKVAVGDDTSLPVGGQIAVVIYVAVGDVKPQIRISKASVAAVDGVQMPVLDVENSGTAHGRLQSFLSGRDAKGIKRDFVISSLPVLAGETRRLALYVDKRTDALAPESKAEATTRRDDPIAYPLEISGTINDGSSSFKFDGRFEP